MAYTRNLDPATPVDTVPARDWPLEDRSIQLDLQERLDSYFVDSDVDPLLAKNLPFVKVFHTISITLPDDITTFTPIIFDSESFDDDGMHDAVNPTRITVPTGYINRLITLQAQIAMTVNPVLTSILHILRVLKNGSTVIKDKTYLMEVPTIISGNKTFVIDSIDKCSSTDYYEIQVAAGSDSPDTRTGSTLTSFEASIR
jgi:hypothetical protein